MKKPQALIILTLSKAPKLKRNVYYLASKLEQDYTSIYRNLMILCEGELIRKVKNLEGKCFFEPTEESVFKAKEALNCD